MRHNLTDKTDVIVQGTNPSSTSPGGSGSSQKGFVPPSSPPLESKWDSSGGSRACDFLNAGAVNEITKIAQSTSCSVDALGDNGVQGMLAPPNSTTLKQSGTGMGKSFICLPPRRFWPESRSEKCNSSSVRFMRVSALWEVVS